MCFMQYWTVNVLNGLHSARFNLLGYTLVEGVSILTTGKI